MAEVLSIKERIERRLVEIFQGISGVKSFHRIDLRGKRMDQADPGAVDLANEEGDSLGNLEGFVLIDEEAAATDANGDIGYTQKTMPFTAAVVVMLDETDREHSAAVTNRWLAVLENAVMADRQLTEPDTSQQLAIDVQITGTSRPPTERGQPGFIAGISGNVIYRHDANDTTVGPGITAKEI